MLACRAAARWPVNGLSTARCLCQPPIKTSRVRHFRVLTEARHQEKEVILLLHFLQKRQQSSSSSSSSSSSTSSSSPSSSPSSSSSSKNNEGQYKPPMPPSKLIFQALRQGLSFGRLFSQFRGQNLRNLFHESPDEIIIAFVLLFGCAAVSVYVIYAYFNYFQAEQFTRFPPEIAKSLRRALYYSNYAPDPKLALKYYKIALDQCKDSGLDPFSDEVIGLRIQLAAWLEKIGKFPNSIDVLEALLLDCKKWVEIMEKSARDGLIDKDGKYKGALVEKPSTSENEDDASAENKEPENLWAKRTRVMGKSVGISVKLGELYADEHVLQGDAAGEHLVWAVETVLKELQRRQRDGIKEGEGNWMSPEEIGGALEALGNHYESKSQHYLAAPLYLQAVTLSPPNNCHAAVLMNNLAISLAQQPVESPFDTQMASDDAKSNQPTNKPPTRAALLSSARSWALQASRTAQGVTGEDRTEECDEACAVAMCNLGDIAAMAGDVKEAKRRFQESLDLSQKLAFTPGITQAKQGLKRLSATPLTKA